MAAWAAQMGNLEEGTYNIIKVPLGTRTEDLHEAFAAAVSITETTYGRLNALATIITQDPAASAPARQLATACHNWATAHHRHHREAPATAHPLTDRPDTRRPPRPRTEGRGRPPQSPEMAARQAERSLGLERRPTSPRSGHPATFQPRTGIGPPRLCRSGPAAAPPPICPAHHGKVHPSIR